MENENYHEIPELKNTTTEKERENKEIKKEKLITKYL